MYRAFFYLTMPGMPVEKGIRFTSQAITTYKYACEVLREMLKYISPDAFIAGGDIERNIGPDVGWVLCDHERENIPG